MTQSENHHKASSVDRFSDKVYKLLCEGLVTLRYEPMEPLNERDLSEQLGIGLAPIREALRRLERERLITIFPRRGTFAAEIGLRDQQSIKEIRLEIEGLAASLAASRATPAERKALVAAADALVIETDSQKRIEGDARIHRQIYAMARNSFLEPMLTMHFNLALRLWYFCSRHAPYPDDEPIDHRDLARAIEAGDCNAARSLLSEHVAEDSDRLRELLYLEGS